MDRMDRRQLLHGGLALVGLGLLSGCGILPPQAPRPAKVPRIGILCTACLTETSSAMAPPGSQLRAFLDGLRELGYVEGENIVLDWRGAEGKDERLPQLASELVGLPVDLIVSPGGTQSALAARQATDRIPIVFIGVGDPVATGLVASYAHPGGNLTGLSSLVPETAAKRLELLKEIVPGARQVDVMSDFSNPAVQPEWSSVQQAAPRLGLTLRRHDARDLAGIEAAFSAIGTTHPDALLLALGSTLIPHRRRIVDLANASGVPAMYLAKSEVQQGGLMSYSADVAGIARRAADYVDRILKGARPADLPVQQPSRFDFVVNLKTAQALGLTIPQSIRDQATEVIE